MENRPAYYKEIIHNQKRRAPWHDYRSRCIYMITINKAYGCYNWGVLDIEKAEIQLTWLGKIIQDEILATPRFNPETRILSSVIMPDHVHFVIYVTQPIKKHLGDIIQAIKSVATRRIRARVSDNDYHVFEDQFHDRILTRKGQLDIIYRYIRENPYRLAVRRRHPEWFRRVNRVVIGGRVLQAYGNVQLLDNPFKYRVVVHRADGPEVRERCRAERLYSAANGGVLVSPFISPAERAVRKEAEELGGNVILVQNEAFDERYKPSAGDFERCEEGKLLIIAPLRSVELTREVCLAMNRLAGVIAGE